MNDRLRLKLGQSLIQESIVGDVANVEVNVLAGQVFPPLDALLDRGDGGQGVNLQLLIPVPTNQAV